MTDPTDALMTRPTRSAPGARAVTLSVSMLATSLLVAVLALLPAPYVVDAPGPTRNVLGAVSSEDDTAMITVEGAPTYTSTGELRLVTVSEYGSPGYPTYVLNVLSGWASPWAVVRPVEDEIPADASQKEIEKQNEEDMVSSQDLATVAALTELGYEVPAVLTVAGLVKDSGADGVLAVDDVIVALDGTTVVDYASLIRILQATEPGTTVQVGVIRNDAAMDLPVVTTEREGGGALLGVNINPTFDPPIDVAISVSGIGGPSAGTIFALGIIDRLTSADEVNGAKIAGTGTIDVLSQVGPIGGITQKLAGADRDGADWFLAPEANCPEVIGHVPPGLRVVSVGTLHEAWTAVVAIGAGEGDSLPTCTP